MATTDEQQQKLERLLELKRGLGEDDPQTRAALLDLANTSFHKRMYAEAVELYRMLVSAQERCLGANHRCTLLVRSIFCCAQAYAGVDSSVDWRRVIRVMSNYYGNDDEIVCISEAALQCCIPIALRH